MKTAVCFSGRMTYPQYADNIRKYVIDPYGADVFIDTWIPMYQTTANVAPSAQDWEKIFVLGPDSVEVENSNIQGFINLYQPKLINLELFDLMPLTHQVRSIIPTNTKTANGHDSPNTKKENVLFMWYKIWKCNQLRKFYEQTNRIRYDLVIRMRFDVTFESFPVIKPEDQPRRKTIYIPQGGDYCGGICDQVAFGDATSMDMYCDLWNEIYRYSVAGIGIHPESMLRKHLEINRLSVERFPAGLHLRGNPQSY